MPERQRRSPQTQTGRERDYTRRDGSDVAPLKLTQRVEQPHGEAIYQPTFPAIWRDEHLTYVKGYDVFFTDYLLAKDGFAPLVNYEHYGLYCDLYFAAERGEKWLHNVFAASRGISPVTLKLMLDRLEDVNLITRVRCMSPGQPVVIVLRTPHTSSELGKRRADLHRRIEVKHTATARTAAPLGQWPRLVWDRGLVEQLVKGGAKVKAIMIVKAVMNDLNNQNPKAEKLSTSEGYFQELKRLCAENKVKLDRKMYETALTFFSLREGWSI